MKREPGVVYIHAYMAVYAHIYSCEFLGDIFKLCACCGQMIYVCYVDVVVKKYMIVGECFMWMQMC